jgi:hypothetical protein
MADLTTAFSISAPVLFVCALSCLWTSMRAARAEDRRRARAAACATFDAYLASFRASHEDAAAHFPELAEFLSPPAAARPEAPRRDTVIAPEALRYLRDNPAVSPEIAKTAVVDVVMYELCRALAQADATRRVDELVHGGRLYVRVVGAAGEALYADPGVYLSPGAPVRLFRELPPAAGFP